MIYLTSFFKQQELPVDVRRFSAAVFQPKGYSFPKADWTDIRDSTGRWTRPRNFIGEDRPPASYRSTLLGIYQGRVREARQWLETQQPLDTALLCWCPGDRAAKRQLELYGSFICHTAVIAEFLITEFNVPIWLDSDRLKMTVLTQREGNGVF